MLPGLAARHTNRGHKSRRLETHIEGVDDFLVSDNGLWHLPKRLAQTDLAIGRERIPEVLARGAIDLETRNSTTAIGQKALRLLDRTKVSDLGCYEGGLRGRQNATEWVVNLANLENNGLCLDDPEDVPHLSACENPDCYNTRHYDLNTPTTSIKKLEDRVDLNPHWYTRQTDGTVQTIWGDSLPTVEHSLKALQEFQAMNWPHVPYKLSTLTTRPISSITIHPITGCWETYTYAVNTAKLVNRKSGYGMVYGPQGYEMIDNSTGEIERQLRRGTMLAHVVTYTALIGRRWEGKELNHLCNYTRCCNPHHLELITPEANRSHGHHARRHITALEKQDPNVKGAHLSAKDRKTLTLQLLAA